MTNSFFQKQHIYLKILYIIIVLIIIFKTEMMVTLFFFLLNILFFFPILVPFLKTIIKLSYFWIFYLICGMIFKVDFMVQINFLLCMIFMLQISVFMQKTICFQVLIHDMKPFLKFKFFQAIILFFLYLNSSFKYLSNSFKEVELETVSLKNKFSFSYIERIIQIIKSVFENTNSRNKVDIFEPNKELALGTRFWANLYIAIIILNYLICTILL